MNVTAKDPSQGFASDYRTYRGLPPLAGLAGFPDAGPASPSKKASVGSRRITTP
jgi:hypothetical protein